MADIVEAVDFHQGMKVRWQGEVWEIVDCQHHKMGRGGAIVRTKLRNMNNGSIFYNSFRPTERFERVILEEKPAQFMYRDGDNYVFMELESYDQVYVPEKALGEGTGYLRDNLEVTLQLLDGRVVGVELPKSVELKVVDTPPGFKGDTVSGGGKPATLETGLVITVPMFVEVGDVVVVDTRTGNYIERAK